MTIFQFELLKQFSEITHGFSLRSGGVSSGSCATLNCGLTPNDNKENVIENRRRLFQELEVQELATMHQIHSKSVECVTRKNMRSERQCDGIITQERGLFLLSLSADCQPALFYDPIQKVIANVHAGWRGQFAGIYERCIETLHAKFGCKPENLYVCIGPSLGPNASEFVHFKEEIPEKYWGYQWKPKYFNLWDIAFEQLKECGILPHHIEIARECTYSNPDLYFSHRRDPKTGRHASLISLI